MAIHVAIAGLGNMGRKIIVPLQEAEDTAAVVGFDPDPAAREHAEKTHGIHTTDRYDAILDDPQIRAVFIATPNHTHPDLTLRALAAGKAVMCEKPIAATLSDAQEMVDYAESVGGFLQIGFELRYSTLYRRAKAWIDAGLIGTVVNTQCTYICSEFHGKGSWRNQRANSGGMFGEKLSHYVDLPRWWIDSPVVDVFSACAPNVIPYYDVRDNYHTTCRYESGAVSHLTFMMAPASTIQHDPLQNHINQLSDSGHELRYLIQGTHGCIETSVFGRRLRRWEFGDSPRQMTSRIAEDLSWPAVEDEVWVHNTSDQAQDIVRRVAAGLPPYTPARDSLETMQLVHAAEASADSGRIVPLSEWLATPSSQSGMNL